MINIELKAAKRAAELCQYSQEPYSTLTMIEALKETAREFSERSKKGEDFKRVIRGIVC